LFDAGRILEYEDIVMEMAEKCCKPNEVSYNLFIDGFYRDGRVEECLSSLKMMLHAKFILGLSICNKLFSYLFDVGELNNVIELFDGMVDLDLMSYVP